MSKVLHFMFILRCVNQHKLWCRREYFGGLVNLFWSLFMCFSFMCFSLAQFSNNLLQTSIHHHSCAMKASWQNARAAKILRKCYQKYLLAFVLYQMTSWTNDQYPVIIAQTTFSRSGLFKNAPKETFRYSHVGSKLLWTLLLASEIVRLKHWWGKGIKDNPLRFLLHFHVFVN